VAQIFGPVKLIGSKRQDNHKKTTRQSQDNHKTRQYNSTQHNITLNTTQESNMLKSGKKRTVRSGGGGGGELERRKCRNTATEKGCAAVPELRSTAPPMVLRLLGFKVLCRLRSIVLRLLGSKRLRLIPSVFAYNHTRCIDMDEEASKCRANKLFK
jgi:hypothetical protein